MFSIYAMLVGVQGPGVYSASKSYEYQSKKNVMFLE
jgi:hypothetical protein